MASFYLAPSLTALRLQANEQWPHRDRSSDGWITAALDLIERRGVVVTDSGCLEYQGYRNELGYGQVRVDRSALLRVHRVVYEAVNGPIPDGLVVRHTCDNPPCCNPDHLVVGTQAENMRDRDERGRHGKAGWKVCPNGHEYPPDRPAKVDKNRCRECARERNRRYQERKRRGR